jgi:hypothetical protein
VVSELTGEAKLVSVCRYLVLQLGLAGPILQVSRTVFFEVSAMVAQASDEDY